MGRHSRPAPGAARTAGAALARGLPFSDRLGHARGGRRTVRLITLPGARPRPGQPERAGGRDGPGRSRGIDDERRVHDGSRDHVRQLVDHLFSLPDLLLQPADHLGLPVGDLVQRLGDSVGVIHGEHSTGGIAVHDRRDGWTGIGLAGAEHARGVEPGRLADRDGRTVRPRSDSRAERPAVHSVDGWGSVTTGRDRGTVTTGRDLAARDTGDRRRHDDDRSQLFPQRRQVEPVVRRGGSTLRVGPDGTTSPVSSSSPCGRRRRRATDSLATSALRTPTTQRRRWRLPLLRSHPPSAVPTPRPRTRHRPTRQTCTCTSTRRPHAGGRLPGRLPAGAGRRTRRHVDGVDRRAPPALSLSPTLVAEVSRAAPRGRTRRRRPGPGRP